MLSTNMRNETTTEGDRMKSRPMFKDEAAKEARQIQKQKFQCEYCGKKFEFASVMIVHILDVHPEERQTT